MITYKQHFLTVLTLSALALAPLNLANAQNAAPNVQILTMDEVPTQPINGLTVKGVTFTDITGATYNAPNGGQLLYVQDPSIEGTTTGESVTMTFATPVTAISFGFALSTNETLIGAVQVQLFDAANNLIGTYFANAQPFTTFSEGEFFQSNVGLIKTAVITFPNPGMAGSFAIDNLAVGDPSEYQVRYASNLAVADSVINITNAGTSATVAVPTEDGNICVNAYIFSPDEQLVSCCSCLVTPNALVSLSARNDFITNTLTPSVPTSVVIKLVASAASTPTTCARSAATAGTGTNLLIPGLAAYGTTLHSLPVTPGTPATTYGVTETPFSTAILSAAELTRITTLCGFIQANGSGFGICRACRLGGLGGSKAQ